MKTVPEITEYADLVAWDMYFSSIVSMSLHPGTSRENAVKRSLKQCAEIADEMFQERSERNFVQYQARRAA